MDFVHSRQYSTLKFTLQGISPNIYSLFTFFTILFFIPHLSRKQTKNGRPKAAIFDLEPIYFSMNRMRMVSTSARVAVPWGFRAPAPLPVMTPFSTAQIMAFTAQSLTEALSG